jgi:hypothetical protein
MTSLRSVISGPLVWPLRHGDTMVVMILHGPQDDAGECEIAGACYHAHWCEFHNKLELIFSPANFSEESLDADF